MKHPFLKKLLVVAAVAAVVSLGILGALAVVPHVHGHDYDHSAHPSCPVHQASLLPFATAVFAVASLVFQALVSFRREPRPLFFFSSVFSSRSSRAPPAL